MLQIWKLQEKCKLVNGRKNNKSLLENNTEFTWPQNLTSSHVQIKFKKLPLNMALH